MRLRNFVLLVIIALLGTFIYLKIASLGDENSNFNQTTRYSLGKHSFLRAVFSLHKDSDARGWYLVGTTPLVLEVVQTKEAPISEFALNDFATKVEKTLGRTVQVYNVDTIKSGMLQPSDYDQIITSFRRHLKPSQPNLFVIYTQNFTSNTEQVGQTYREFAIVLSNDRLNALAENNSAALDQYISSTLLHEFGHQLGLGHVSNAECIMNKDVENPKRTFLFTGRYTPTEFCDEELDNLRKIKASLE